MEACICHSNFYYISHFIETHAKHDAFFAFFAKKNILNSSLVVTNDSLVILRSLSLNKIKRKFNVCVFMYMRLKFIITIIKSVHSSHFIQQEFNGFCLFDQLEKKIIFEHYEINKKFAKNYEK